MRNILFHSILLLTASMLSWSSSAQSTSNKDTEAIAKEFSQQFFTEKQQALEMAQQKGWIIREEYPGGKVIELMKLSSNGMPQYYTTTNLDAAITVGTIELWPSGSAGLNLTGNGMLMGIWDAGIVRPTHQEFGNRVTQIDTPSFISSHATHVAGTMIAAGIDPDAKGMASQADLNAWNWNNDISEMTIAAANGLPLSNHSYAYYRGWNFWSGDMYWWGDPSVSPTEDYLFGFYDDDARNWDVVAANAPFYTIVKAAANNRGENHTGGHYYWDGSNYVWSTDYREPDGGLDGYDCITNMSTAKNILTLGAVYDIPGGYSQSSDVVLASFSGTGPMDDGRIKPDIVANGIGLYSTGHQSDTDYSSKSGTSMASPNTTGTLALLQEHYQNLNGGLMTSAALKGLVINTANEAGQDPGPDYKFGWGLLNSVGAAEVISADNGSGDFIKDQVTLNDGDAHQYVYYSDGSEDIYVTISWTDVPGTPPPPSLDPLTKILVNDLDLRVSDNDKTIYYPWNLDPLNPDAAAFTGDNDVDNVETVYIQNPPAGEYTIEVSHKGSISTQDYALIIRGLSPDQPGIVLDLKVFLEGPFNGVDMNADLNTSNLLPTDQPYDSDPTADWYYTGNESVGAIPNNDVVDWLLVELRDAPDAGSATGATIIARQPAFLLNDGSVAGLDGSSLLSVNASVSQNLFVVVYHRNHLGIMSANALTESGGVRTYDFSNAAGKVYGGTNGHKQLAAGVWGMIGGDGQPDSEIANTDKNNVWSPQAGSFGYLMADFNLDGQAENADKNIIWIPNSGKGSQVVE